MHKSSNPLIFWLGLASISGVGRATFRKIVSRFGSPEQALTAGDDELRIEGLSQKAIKEIASQSWQGFAEQELEKARVTGVTILTEEDLSYPAALKTAPDHPLFLYIKGNFKQEDGIAIVGTRKPTHYGLTVTHRISYTLAEAGFCVVSGLARGIDTQAHKGALAARGRTIAVLGCGIDVAYPPENKALMEQISRNGAVVSENPFGTQPEPGYFPARNRIVSGLSRGTVIIEATEDSGSLITAKYAIEHGRKLFSVPGNIGSPNSKGTNNLIKQGAVLVQDAADILRELGVQKKMVKPETVPLPALSDDEDRVLRCITHDAKHIDIIMNESRTVAGMLSGLLINLELQGLITQLPGKYYVRNN